MQTFLPYPDFEKTAECLDLTRLNNQINEALIIYKSLKKLYPKGKGWNINHPAIKMWQGSEDALLEYRNICLQVYTQKQVVKSKHIEILPYKNIVYPYWLGWNKFHSSHRSALLHKNYDHYKQFNWAEEPKIELFYPTKN